jgi:hypothetical protein
MIVNVDVDVDEDEYEDGTHANACWYPCAPSTDTHTHSFRQPIAELHW